MKEFVYEEIDLTQIEEVPDLQAAASVSQQDEETTQAAPDELREYLTLIFDSSQTSDESDMVDAPEVKNGDHSSDIGNVYDSLEQPHEIENSCLPTVYNQLLATRESPTTVWT